MALSILLLNAMGQGGSERGKALMSSPTFEISDISSCILKDVFVLPWASLCQPFLLLRAPCSVAEAATVLFYSVLSLDYIQALSFVSC